MIKKDVVGLQSGRQFALFKPDSKNVGLVCGSPHGEKKNDRSSYDADFLIFAYLFIIEFLENYKKGKLEFTYQKINFIKYH